MKSALAGIDLNLVVLLQALLEEKSVTRAASRVGLSQPAASNALSRLRLLLDDPILVRSGRAMVPTARALSLTGPVGEALDLLQGALLERETFDPSQSARTFRIASTDLGDWRFLWPLLPRLRTAAPRTGIEIWPAGEEAPTEALAAGALDLALGVWFRPPPELGRADLALEHFSVITRLDHPLCGETLDLETFCALDHVLVSARGRTSAVVDFALDAKGRKRRVAVVVPRFLEVPSLVASSDLCATIPASLAAHAARSLPLRIYPPPLGLPSFPLRLLWHRRADSDPGLAWLRGQLAAASREGSG